MKLKTIIFITFLLPILFLNAQNIKISSDFPGGNIVVNKIVGDTVWLKPDLSFTNGKWFYWYFKISGISDKTIIFKFDPDFVTHGVLTTRYGPAYSLNNDETWKWYGENRVEDYGFSYSFSEQDTVAYFSIAFPYTEKNLYSFLETLHNRESLKVDTLCLSPENRVIEKIIIPSLNKEPTHKVLITARHHACEMTADYVLEGIIKSLLNDVNLQKIRENTEFMIIPFVDKDGVENGEQGKNRIPRDHNRDYSGESIHNSTDAIRKTVPNWSDNKIKLALDIHCPALYGRTDEYIYNVGLSNYEIGQNQIIFSKLLEKNSLGGELKLYHDGFLPFGKVSWNSSTSSSQGARFDEWASSLEGISIATTIEFPYGNVSGVMVSKDNARAFGEAVAYSIKDYLDLLDKK